MIFILIPLVIAMFVIRHFLPARWGVHAARANKNVGKGRLVAAGLIVDEDGRHVSLTGTFVGKVEGSSMFECGLDDGATFIARVLNDEERKHLRAGDVVVVDDVAAHSNSGLRLRKVRAVTSDGFVAFANHTDGAPHKSRPWDRVKARVEYVVA